MVRKNYCRRLALVAHQNEFWIEYHTKSKVNKYPVSGLKEGLDLMPHFIHGVDEWLDEETEENNNDRA